ncbi:site-specific integrase [Palleniella muris]|uniref:Site-specific integrase n=1 Tax=Palleniella muris TaxID=3038145 RepID=A0AC61QRB3_9BACT|nr:site-specific integrase [Palleniella muris]TGX82616.1 site-specific integrase [Palleniella muris]
MFLKNETNNKKSKEPSQGQLNDKTPFKFLPKFKPCKRAQSSNGKDDYIYYCTLDETTNKYVRHKIMLNRYKKGRERDMMAAQLSAQVFNMFFKAEAADALSLRRSATVAKVIGLYSRYIASMAEKGHMKWKTKVDYFSRISILSEYIEDRRLSELEIGRVDTSFFVDFLDYVFLDRVNSSTTRNNYRTWCSAFCSWLVERNYLDSNPIAGIRALPEKKKFREPLSTADIRKLSEHLRITDKRFLLACMFEYYEMIRPIELVQIRIRDISMSDLTLFVPSSVSKNNRDGLIALNENVARLLVELEVFDYPDSFFLFGKDMQPSNMMARSDIFRKKFEELRHVLCFPMTYQFYSLKDSGIRDLSNACGVVTAKEQARHTDISTTNRYLVGKDGNVDDVTKHFNGFM